MPLGSVGEKFELYLISIYGLELIFLSPWNWCQFLSLFNIYVYLSCLEKVCEEERNGNSKGNGRGVQIC